jgi:hypothetical protein
MASDAREVLFGDACSRIRKMKNILKILSLAGLLLLSCDELPVETIFVPVGDKKGVFITCEGNYMYGNSSLSFYDKEKKQVYNQVFYARNGAPLGDVAQSMAVHGNYLFVVVNNSGKVVALDPVTLEYIGVVPGLVSPRYVEIISDHKGYISDLYARRITIFDPVTLQKTGTIVVSDGKPNSVKHPTETFARFGNKVFVTCWSYDNQVLVIDSDRDQVTDSITVPPQPKRIVTDRKGKIWVLTGGSPNGSAIDIRKPALVRIDPETHTVEQIYEWGVQAGYPGDMKLNREKDTLLIIAGDLYKMAVTERRLPVTPFIKAGKRLFFSLGIDPGSGDIYISDALDYARNAVIYRYTLFGTAIDTFTVGINPGDFLFN